MWDGVHAGHRFLTSYVARLGRERSLVPTVVTFRNHPLSVVSPDRAPLLLSDTPSRLRMLGEAGAEECILLDFDGALRGLSAEEFLSMLKRDFGVDAIVVGYNNRFGHDRLQGIEAYQALGSRIGMEIIPGPEFRHDDAKVSSSVIRKFIAGGDVAEAARLLGRPFSLTGRVVEGKKLGRSIGFPTANIAVAPGMIMPLEGVYACRAVTAEGQSYAAMVNIGRRPTVDAPGAPVTVEAHLLGFSGSLYGSEVTLEFISRIRAEIAFGSLAELTDQLRRDAEATRGIVGGDSAADAVE